MRKIGDEAGGVGKKKPEGEEVESRKQGSETNRKATTHKADPLKKPGQDRPMHELQVDKAELEVQNDEIRRTMAELKASEEKYCTIVDSSYDWEYLKSPEGSFIYVSPSCKSTTGYGPEAFLQDPDLMLKIIHPDDRDIHIKHRKEALAINGVNHPVDFRIIKRDGDEVWIGHRCQKVFSRDGKYIGVRGSNRNITGRKRTEKVLFESEQQYHLLADYANKLKDISVSFTETSDMQDLFNRIADSFRLFTGSIVATFAVYHKETQYLQLVSLSTDSASKPKIDAIFGPEIFEMLMPIGPDMQQELLNQGIRRFKDIRELSVGVISQENSDLFMQSVGCNQIVACPISDGVEIAGVCTAYLSESLSMVPDDILKTYLHMVRAYAKRQQIAEALRESEKHYRLLAENSEDVIWTLDPQFRFTYISPSVFKLRGLTPEEAIQEVFTDTLAPDSVKKVRETIAVGLPDFEKGLPMRARLDVEQYRKDGSTVWVEISVKTMTDDAGMLRGFVGISRDISERKQVEGQLKKSEAKYRLLSEHTADIVWLMDMDLKITYQSPSAEKQTGYTSHELRELHLEERITPESLKLALEVFNKDLPRIVADQAYNPITVLELEYCRKDGTTFWAESKFSIIRDGSGKPVSILGEARDIAERKSAEAKLIKSYESIKKTLDDAINTMVKIVELRDPYTAGHQQKVADLATAIAREMKLEDSSIDQIRTAALIHDIGKIYVPSDILSKPGKLSDIELGLIKTHSRSGYDIVKGMDFPCSIARAILEHHERLDGSGYPDGITGEDMLLESKILVVADVVEAMAAHRPYRPALGIAKALEEISKNRGTLYDPVVVNACIDLFSSGRFKFQ